MKKAVACLFAIATVVYPVIDPRIPQQKATPSTAVATTAGGLIVGLDGGTYQPYSTAIVAKVQGALAAKGFYKGEATGVFDKETMNAIAAFQKQNGLTVSGVPSPSTRRLLFRQ
jgi:peptidoglycan hydrolase-like protein with peptidoglycan-binding domain